MSFLKKNTLYNTLDTTLPAFYFISIYVSLLFLFIYMLFASSCFLETVTQTATCCSNWSTACCGCPDGAEDFGQFACVALIFCSSSVKPRQPNIPSIKLHVVTLRKHLLSSITKCFPLLQGNWEQGVQRCVFGTQLRKVPMQQRTAAFHAPLVLVQLCSFAAMAEATAAAWVLTNFPEY